MRENNTDTDANFDDWLNDLTNQPQPTCNIDDPDNCDSCGS